MKLNVQSIKTIDKTNVATKAEAKEFSEKSDNVVKINTDSVTVRKGFNIREDFTDVVELADSIEQLGLLKPIAIDILKDGSAILTDGERRYRAILMLRGKSVELKQQFEKIDAVVNSSDKTDADRVVTMMAHNTGKPLHPMEEAEGFRRLRDEYKLDLTTISKKVGRSVPYVEQKLLLADSDHEEKESVRKGKISATAQIALARKEKDPAKRKAIVKAATAKGKKVKVKDIKQTPLTKECDKAIDLIKQADKANKDAAVGTILFELDAQVRAIKEALKAK